MHTRVHKWGNSLAIRIPKPFAEDARIKQGSVVDLSLEKGKIVAAPVAGEGWTLAGLLAGVTRKNLPREIDLGAPVGREVW